MHRFTLPILALAALAGAGCSPIHVSTDYDPAIDFSRFRTWAWEPESLKADTAGGVRPHLFSIQRARHAVEQELAAAGYSMAPAEEADFLVDVNIGVERHVRVRPYYVSPGWGWGYRWGPWWSGYWDYPPEIYAYENALLILDVLQNKPSRQPAWRGVAELPLNDAGSPDERSGMIREAVSKTLAPFPPPP